MNIKNYPISLGIIAAFLLISMLFYAYVYIYSNQVNFEHYKHMVWVPGGVFWMGCTESTFYDAQPWHRVYVDGFWMDKTAVTNEQFHKFVEATGYVTVAQRKPNPQDYPEVPPENLVPGSLVFCKPKQKITLTNYRAWWQFIPGACWKHPEGPASTNKGREKHPVVHIAWEDACAYATWAGKQLPTEAEWERAARAGRERQYYYWGNILKPAGKWQCNIWQGEFPYINSKEDGFEGTAPVASFPPNPYGLYDMAGNVWQWCSDWYSSEYYKALAKNTITYNPQGPDTSFDPQEPGTKKKVQRGGSFLCSDTYCKRYIAGARGKGAIDSSASHIGFRCIIRP